MLLESVKICLSEEIGHLAIGNNKTQAWKAHAYPSIISRFIKFMNEFNIGYVNDYYEIDSRQKQEEMLGGYGMDVGVNFGASSITHQPRCFVGFYASSWLIHCPGISVAQINKYFDDKIPLMKKYLGECKESRNQIHSNLDYSREIDVKSDFNKEIEEFGILDKLIKILFYPIKILSQLYFKTKR